MKSFVLALGLWMATAGILSAQESRATLLGTVTDQSGAVVPGVEVAVVNANTNVRVTLITSQSGYYEATFLIPGRYRLEGVLAGFKRYVREDIELRTGERVTLDFKLELGQPNEQVTVVATAPMLETSTASAGQVIDNRRISELPVTDMSRRRGALTTLGNT